VTPLDSVVGMQQNIAKPVRCQKKRAQKYELITWQQKMVG